MTDSSATTQADGELPWFISVDDHVIESPTVWSDRLSAKFREKAPHYERRRVGKTRWNAGSFVTDKDDNGTLTDVWIFDEVVKPIRRNIASVGLAREEMDLNPISFDEMRRGCFDPVARLEDMDLNHVEASLCFPQMIRFCGQEFSETKDRDLGLACIRAYNDWTHEEWCATSPERLIPLGVVPLWDGELAAAEVRRNAGRGFHAVSFSENPWVLGFPSIHSGFWDPFFEACAETATTICMHIGSSSKMETVSPDAPPAVGISLSSNNAISSLMEYLFSGILTRWPSLRLGYAESQVGWIPYQLERADTVLAGAPGMERRAGRGDARATVVLLLPPGLRLLLPRLLRRQEPARGRCRQRHIRSRLPAHRLDLAADRGTGQGDVRRAQPGGDLQGLPGQRDQDAPPGQGSR